VTGVMDGAVKG